RGAAPAKVGLGTRRGPLVSPGRGGQTGRALPRPDEGRAEQVGGARCQASAGAQESERRSLEAAEPDGHGLSPASAGCAKVSPTVNMVSPTVNMPWAC